MKNLRLFSQCLVIEISELRLQYDNYYGNAVDFKTLIDTKNENHFNLNIDMIDVNTLHFIYPNLDD